MANSISTISESTAPNAAEALAESTGIAIEQRTDITVDELERMSLPYPAELYDGRIVYKMPNYAHSVIQANLTRKIGNFLETHPIGLVGGNGNFRLWPDRARESRAPDVTFILSKNLPKDFHRYPTMAPDLAIEILSPDDSFDKIMEKVEEYLDAGTKTIWLVIASTREVLVCKPEGKHSVRDVLTAPELLPGFELPVQDIFAGVETAATSK